MIRTIQALIADGELRQAIQYFLEKTEPDNPDILHQSFLLSRVEKDNRDGVLSHDELRREMAKISRSLIEILSIWKSETQRKKREAEEIAEREWQVIVQKRLIDEATEAAHKKHKDEQFAVVHPPKKQEAAFHHYAEPTPQELKGKFAKGHRILREELGLNRQEFFNLLRLDKKQFPGDWKLVSRVESGRQSPDTDYMYAVTSLMQKHRDPSFTLAGFFEY